MRLGLMMAFAVFLAVAVMMFATATQAQIAPGITTQETRTAAESNFAPLLEEARKKGMSVVVISPDGDGSASQADAAPSYTEMGIEFRNRLRAILTNVPNIGSQFMAALRSASPDGTSNWLWIAIAVSVGGILTGNGIGYLFRRYNQKRFERIFNPDPQTRSEKIGFLLFRASMIALNCVIMFVAAMVAALIFDYGHEPSRATILVIVSGYIAYWVFRAVIFFNIIAHDLPNHRMVNLDDDAAKTMQYDWRNSMVAIIIAFAFCAWTQFLGIDQRAHNFFLLLAMALATLIFGGLMIRHHTPIAGAILGAGAPEQKPLWRRVLASNWHLLFLAYLLVSWLGSSFQLVMQEATPAMLIAAPAIALVAALPLYGILLMAIDRYYASRRNKFDQMVRDAQAQREEEERAETAARIEAQRTGDQPETEVVEHIVSHDAQQAEQPVFRPVFKPLLEQAGGILVTIVSVGFVLGAWDVRVGDRGNPVTAFMDTLVVIFAAWLAYRAVAIYIDSRLEEEGVPPHGAAAVMEDEPGGHGVSRLGTLLPLVRNVLIVTIIVIAAMIVLSNLGVDIAPLFAGAGVIGLAVGFGAQALIRDIFSGGFFLFDDAFRKGEYIELGEIRGTVEKISLRSFQLRHHNGPLHTIPFGEIKQLTNYSRDWVIMKLPLRVTYDTDVERVRKLVKKLGQKLLDHPEVGKNFLQPLKSQGVIQMDDSAMIMRVKFMTKPGDQWTTRKVVYMAIQELFHREGIQFANKEVTVRLANEPAAGLDDVQKQAVAAAARRAIDDDAAQQPVPVDDR